MDSKHFQDSRRFAPNNRELQSDACNRRRLCKAKIGNVGNREAVVRFSCHDRLVEQVLDSGLTSIKNLSESHPIALVSLLCLDKHSPASHQSVVSTSGAIFVTCVPERQIERRPGKIG